MVRKRPVSPSKHTWQDEPVLGPKYLPKRKICFEKVFSASKLEAVRQDHQWKPRALTTLPGVRGGTVRGHPDTHGEGTARSQLERQLEAPGPGGVRAPQERPYSASR